MLQKPPSHKLTEVMIISKDFEKLIYQFQKTMSDREKKHQMETSTYFTIHQKHHELRLGQISGTVQGVSEKKRKISFFFLFLPSSSFLYSKCSLFLSLQYWPQNNDVVMIDSCPFPHIQTMSAAKQGQTYMWPIEIGLLHASVI